MLVAQHPVRRYECTHWPARPFKSLLLEPHDPEVFTLTPPIPGCPLFRPACDLTLAVEGYQLREKKRSQSPNVLAGFCFA